MKHKKTDFAPDKSLSTHCSLDSATAVQVFPLYLYF